MTRGRKVLIGLGSATVVLVGALALAGGDDGSDLPAPFRTGVDSLEANKDCAALQSRFDSVSDADYLKYIDDAMRDAGCYD